MRLAIRNSRSAFSLLEMVIAMAIGMLLLAALYAFMSTQIMMTQAGRDVIEEGALVRAIFTRLGNDIISQVGPYDPRMVNAPPPATTATLSGSTGSAANSGTTVAAPTTSASGSSTAATPPPAPVVTYNIGIYGTATMLQLANYRVQTAPPGILTGTVDPNIEIISDLRRVTYWLAQGNGTETLGLARYEFRQATADAINQDPTTLPDQLKSIIAKEVLSITFEYFDGTTWQPQWDSTELCADEITPMGPPVAIRITMTLRRNAGRGQGSANPANDQGPTYVHVVAMPAVNFFTQGQTQSQ